MQGKHIVIKITHIKGRIKIMNQEDYWKENVRQLNDKISYQPLAADTTKIQSKIDVILETGLSAVHRKIKRLHFRNTSVLAYLVNEFNTV